MADNKNIILTEFEDGAGVLIDLQHKRYYQLNEIAVLIWRGLQQGTAMSLVIRQITENYDVCEAEITHHTAQLIRDFAACRLGAST